MKTTFASLEIARQNATTMAEKRELAAQGFAYIADCEAELNNALAVGMTFVGEFGALYTVVSVGAKRIKATSVGASGGTYVFTYYFKRRQFISNYAVQIVEAQRVAVTAEAVAVVAPLAAQLEAMATAGTLAPEVPTVASALLELELAEGDAYRATIARPVSPAVKTTLVVTAKARLQSAMLALEVAEHRAGEVAPQHCKASARATWATLCAAPTPVPVASAMHEVKLAGESVAFAGRVKYGSAMMINNMRRAADTRLAAARRALETAQLYEASTAPVARITAERPVAPPLAAALTELAQCAAAMVAPAPVVAAAPCTAPATRRAHASAVAAYVATVELTEALVALGALSAEGYAMARERGKELASAVATLGAAYSAAESARLAAAGLADPFAPGGGLNW